MKYRVIIFVFCFLFLSFQLSAADTWIKTYDPFNELLWNVEDVIVCSDGGYAINGTYVDSETNIYWGFVLKTDSDGNMLWAKRDTVNFQYQNESRAIVETEYGGILSASYINIGGTALIKRDAGGHREWAYLLENLYVHSMDNTTDNNIIAAGTKTVNDISNAMIAKLTENGEILWSNYFEFENSLWSVITSVTQSVDEGYLLTGYVKYNETGEDVLVIKTDANGDSLWTKIYDGYGNDDIGKKIIEDTQGNLYISGFFEAGYRTWYRFLIKMNSIGGLLYLLNNEYSIDFYGCGRMVDVIMNNKIVGYGIIENEITLSAYDYDGENLWNTPLPIHTTGSGDKNLQLANDGFVLAGYSYSYDLVLVKTDSSGQIVSVDDEIIPVTNNMNSYPNPFTSQTTIKFSINYPSKVLLQIYNVKGQLVKNLLNEDKLSGEYTIIWNAQDLSSGVYFIKLSSNSCLLTSHKIILLK